ncbi:TraK domain-containing protein [Pseudomonas aeruginosa]
MKPNNLLRSFAVVALAAAVCGQASAKELVIPTMPSSAQKKAEVVPPNQADIDPSEFGVGMPDQESAAKKALAEAQVASANKASQPAPEKEPEILEVSGGGAGKDLQSVPASVAKNTASSEQAEVVPSLQEVVVQPGVNTIIPAAVNHLNRIVTPFETPIVQSVSGAEISVKENVIYVSTESESPVTMYITPNDDESVAISLTLAPRKVPPIQANLILAGAGGLAAGGARAPGAGGSYGFHYSGQAKKWEEGQPYMDAIKKIMTSLALGNMPKGYSIGKASNMDTVPACSQEGISFDFSKAQIIMGHNFKVLVGVARNQASVPVLFDETSCTHPSLAATAVWPRNMLEPGDKTEVYVVTRVGDAPAEESTRPSLLN